MDRHTARSTPFKSWIESEWTVEENGKKMDKSPFCSNSDQLKNWFEEFQLGSLNSILGTKRCGSKERLLATYSLSREYN